MKFERPAFFPIRLFRWFVTQHLLFSTILFIALNGSLLLWIEQSGRPEEFVHFGYKIALISLASAFLVLILTSILMAARLVFPLGRLIEKSRRLREFPFEAEETEPEALTYDEPGEWFELERALNRLGRDLRTKTIHHSR